MASEKLTALKVKSLTTPGRYGDGGGLWLQVRAAGKDKDGEDKPANRSWLFRYMLDGKARQMGLGPADDVTLAKARSAAQAARRLLLDRVDPIDHREKDQAAKRAVVKAMSFKEVAGKYLAAHKDSWRNEKHRWQWGATLEKHAYPVIGDTPIDQIGTSEVMQILEPVWQKTPETASRLRGRIESVLDYAKAREWRSGENPARWRGHIANMLPRRNKRRTVQHHPALPWARMGEFMAALRGQGGTAALALQFTILTAARSDEAISATWGEIDIAAKVWAVPGARMKAAKEHRVPLSSDALAVLATASKQRTDITPAGFVFPGARPKKPLSNMSMVMLVRRMNEHDEGQPVPWSDGKGEAIVPHGFRSAFRDWAAESTGFAREVAEAALAHTVADRVEAAYRRGDLFEKRRQLMQDWAAFCNKVPEKRSDKIPHVRAAGA
jgi:integrase